jgi:hypothetical protein
VHEQLICSLLLPGLCTRLKTIASAAQQVASCSNLYSRSTNERRVSLDWPHEKPNQQQRSTATNALAFDIAAIGQFLQQEATVEGEQGFVTSSLCNQPQRHVLVSFNQYSISIQPGDTP